MAHLRGHMRPGRHLGIQGRIRDSLVLMHTQMEIEAETEQMRLMAFASAAGPRVKAGSLEKIISESVNRWRQFTGYGFDRRTDKEIASLAELYIMLRQSGAFEKD